MEMQAPKGTKDMLPQDAYKWHFVEKTFRDVSKYYGMREIRTPMFEHTEVFARGVGDTTDIVQKEMYTFNDKGNRSITLKPEVTAGAGRAFIESRLFNEAQPTKLYYIIPCFRANSAYLYGTLGIVIVAQIYAGVNPHFRYFCHEKIF